MDLVDDDVEVVSPDNIAVDVGENGSSDIDKEVQNSTAFENFVLQPYTQKSQSTVWNHFKSLYIKDPNNLKIAAVKKLFKRFVCAPCFKNGRIKR